MSMADNEIVRRVDDAEPRKRRGPVRWLAEKAMQMWYALRSEHTPGWAKTAVIGAAVYVISWIDFVPDLLPVVGVVDDFFVIVAAVFTVMRHVTDEDRRRARETVARWLGR